MVCALGVMLLVIWAGYRFSLGPVMSAVAEGRETSLLAMKLACPRNS